LAPGGWRNLALRFENQLGQRDWVAVRGVRQVYVVVVVVVVVAWELEFGSVVVVMGRRRDGTDTRAENGLRRVRERVLQGGVRRGSGWNCGYETFQTYCHSIADAREGKVDGRFDRYVCICANASMADPSTTSSTA
jgi:hypothetical protein